MNHRMIIILVRLNGRSKPNCIHCLLYPATFFVLTYWGRDKMPFSRPHLPMDFREWKCMNFDYNFIICFFNPRGLVNDNPALVKLMAWRRPEDKLLYEPMMISLLAHIYVTRPQWINIVMQERNGCCFANKTFWTHFWWENGGSLCTYHCRVFKRVLISTSCHWYRQ